MLYKSSYPENLKEIDQKLIKLSQLSQFQGGKKGVKMLLWIFT